MNVVLLLLPALFWTISGILLKHGSRRLDFFVYEFLNNVSGLLFIVFFINSKINFGEIWRVLILGIIYFAASFTYYLVLRRMHAYITSSITLVSVPVAVLLSLIIWGESLTPLQVIGGALVLFGALLVSMEKLSFSSIDKLGVLYAVISAILWGIADFWLKGVTPYFNSFQIVFFVSLVFIIISLPFVYRKFKEMVSNHSSFFSLFGGLSANLGLMAFSICVLSFGVSISSVFSTFYVPLIAICEWFFESVELRLHRIVGVILSVIGVIAISL